MSMESAPAAAGDLLDGETVGEAAWRHIRADILAGRLAPERKLKLDALRELYGVSVSTLREVLNRLATEGLVVAEGQRGFVVTPVSVENLREIAELRLLLECQALEDSFRAGDVEWEGRVVAAYHKLAAMEARMEKGDRSALDLWKRYDWEFHQSLISACGSKVLMQLHGAAFDKYLRYQMIALSFRGDIAADEHRSMLDCALRRDATEAQRFLTQHLEGGMQHALATGTIQGSNAAARGKHVAGA